MIVLAVGLVHAVAGAKWALVTLAATVVVVVLVVGSVMRMGTLASREEEAQRDLPDGEPQ